MARPLTRDQQIENTAFLRHLRLSGNVRAAARAVGVGHSTLQHRRSRHPAFATRWDAALASAQARLNGKGASRPEARSPGADGAYRTAGGEPVIIRLKTGKLQVRAAQPNKLTCQCAQAFLLALSATANIRLSAAAAGASEKSFYKLRDRDPGFAREWRRALAQGYEQLEAALLESFDPESHADDAWTHNEPPALPPMTTAQALQLLYLHQKEARLLAEPQHLKRRRGESREAHSYRLGQMYQLALEREREKFRVAQAARAAAYGLARHEQPITLPDLAQVAPLARPPNGSVRKRADDAAPDPASPPAERSDRALFGGWRIGTGGKRERR